MTTYKRLIAEVRACQICAGDLPWGHAPLFGATPVLKF